MGVWRLEVMPDAINVSDPFAKASPKKEVSSIQWQTQLMEILLPELGTGFKVSAINDSNTYTTHASDNKFKINPGTYILTKQSGFDSRNAYTPTLKEFAAPRISSKNIVVVHTPYTEVSSNKPF